MTKKITIIFGAGASYAAGQDMIENFGKLIKKQELVPPLTDDLFEFQEIILDFPKATELKPEINHRRKKEKTHKQQKSIEYILETLSNEGNEEGLISIKRYLNSLFTSIDKNINAYPQILNGNLYLRFLNKLKKISPKTKITILTFNYDLFIDNAFAKAFNIELKNFDSYTDNENYKLFKLHGSCNWWTIDKNHFNNSKSDEEYNYSNQDKEFIFLTKQIEHDIQIDNTSKFPVIAIPIIKDKKFVHSNFEKKIDTELMGSNLILSIGWSSSDKYFKDILLKNYNEKTIFISPKAMSKKTKFRNKSNMSFQELTYNEQNLKNFFN